MAWMRTPHDFGAREREFHRRWEATQRIGNRVLGFIWGAALACFFWFLSAWVDAGGCPYISQ